MKFKLNEATSSKKFKQPLVDQINQILVDCFTGLKKVFNVFDPTERRFVGHELNETVELNVGRYVVSTRSYRNGKIAHHHFCIIAQPVEFFEGTQITLSYDSLRKRKDKATDMLQKLLEQNNIDYSDIHFEWGDRKFVDYSLNILSVYSLIIDVYVEPNEKARSAQARVAQVLQPIIDRIEEITCTHFKSDEHSSSGKTYKLIFTSENPIDKSISKKIRKQIMDEFDVKVSSISILYGTDFNTKRMTYYLEVQLKRDKNFNVPYNVFASDNPPASKLSRSQTNNIPKSNKSAEDEEMPDFWNRSTDDDWDEYDIDLKLNQLNKNVSDDDDWSDYM